MDENLMKENEESREDKESSRRPVVIGAAVAAVLTIAILGLVGMNVKLLVDNQKISRFIDDEYEYQARLLESANEEYIEDGYSIDGIYTIYSTKNISDAYLSGDTSGLTEEELATYELAKAVLEECITTGMDSYDKEMAIIDWICENVTTGASTSITRPGTNTAAMVSTPYGVLSGHNAVCVGYATTFRLLLNMCDINVHIVHSDYHSWDLVQMEDGEWYHVDLYSEVDEHTWAYVNLTDSQMAENWDWDGQDTLPAAQGTEYSCANRNAQTITDVMNLPALVYERAAGNHDSFALYYKKDGGYTEEDYERIEYLVNYMSQAMWSGEMSEEFESKYIGYSWAEGSDDDYILCLNVVDYASGEDIVDVDEDEEDNTWAEEALEAVNEAFGVDLNGSEDYDPDYDWDDDWEDEIEYDSQYGYLVGSYGDVTYYAREADNELGAVLVAVTTTVTEDGETVSVEYIDNKARIKAIAKQLYGDELIY